MKKILVKLKNGTTVEGDEFSIDDYTKLKSIFLKWININVDLKSLGGRSMNVPDVLSEALYCVFFNAVRTNGTASSYDAVDKKTGEGLQIKSASISVDCSSFGPTSTWDKLIFIDFAPYGSIDGNVCFYEIESSNIYGIILNEAKGETFLEQQNQGRRPRFSIKREIINAKGLDPIKKINLME